MCMCSIQPLDTAVEMICNVVYGTVIFFVFMKKTSALCLLSKLFKFLKYRK